MSFDKSYRRDETMTINPDDDRWMARRDNVSCVIVKIETEPSPFRGLMFRVKSIQEAFEEHVPASRILEAALYDLTEESIVALLSVGSDWTVREDWVGGDDMDDPHSPRASETGELVCNECRERYRLDPGSDAIECKCGHAWRVQHVPADVMDEVENR